MDTIKVRLLPNPYHLDHKGRPSGAVMKLPHGGAFQDDENRVGPNGKPAPYWAPREYVGATREAKVLRPAVIQRVAGVPHVTREAVHDRVWKHSSDPVVIAIEDFGELVYYREHVMTGDLVAADKDTWVAFGGDPKTYRDPYKVLAELKAAAIAKHVAHHGEASVPKETHEHFASVLAKKPEASAPQPEPEVAHVDHQES